MQANPGLADQSPAALFFKAYAGIACPDFPCGMAGKTGSAGLTWPGPVAFMAAWYLPEHRFSARLIMRELSVMPCCVSNLLMRRILRPVWQAS